jgi:hypothetical protein
LRQEKSKPKATRPEVRSVGLPAAQSHGRIAASPSYAFAKPASDKVNPIGFPFSKTSIARLRPFFSFSIKLNRVGFVIRHATILVQQTTCSVVIASASHEAKMADDRDLLVHEHPNRGVGVLSDRRECGTQDLVACRLLESI